MRPTHSEMSKTIICIRSIVKNCFKRMNSMNPKEDDGLLNNIDCF